MKKRVYARAKSTKPNLKPDAPENIASRRIIKSGGRKGKEQKSELKTPP